MEFLESVGLLAILGVVVVLALNYASSKENPTIETPSIDSSKKIKTTVKNSEDRKKEMAIEKIQQLYEQKFGELPKRTQYKKFIKYSSKCQDAIYEHNMEVSKSNIQISSNPLNKKIKKILSDPLEYWSAVYKYLKELDFKENQENLLRKQDYLAIRYHELIFQIFEGKKYQDIYKIQKKAQKRFKYSFDEIMELVFLWTENKLIRECKVSKPMISLIEHPKMSDQAVYRLDVMLETDYFLEGNRLSYFDWLNKRNLKFIDNWDEYYIDKPDY